MRNTTKRYSVPSQIDGTRLHYPIVSFQRFRSHLHHTPQSHICIHLNPSTPSSIHHCISHCLTISFTAEVGVARFSKKEVGVASNNGPACVVTYTSGYRDGQPRLVLTRSTRWLRVGRSDGQVSATAHRRAMNERRGCGASGHSGGHGRVSAAASHEPTGM